MPSADQLSADQVRRRIAVLTTLGQAGWRPDNPLWDAGIATDFVASMLSPGPGTALRCDYVIASEGGGLPEHLSLQWSLLHGPVRFIVDFLGQTAKIGDRLDDVLAVLVRTGAHPVTGPPGAPATAATPAAASAAAASGAQGGADPAGTADSVHAVADALSRICPVFTIDVHGRLIPIGAGPYGADAAVGRPPWSAGQGPGPAAGGAGGWDGIETPTDDLAGIQYADEVEERLYRELVPAGWRRSPADAVLSGALETFYVDNGPARLSVGRCNGEETLVRVTVPDASVHLRVDGVARPAHADRLVSLLRHWQARLTPGSWREFVSALAASYPKVHVEDPRGNWSQVRARAPRGPAAPLPGRERRGAAIGARLHQAGWTTVAGGPTVSMYAENAHRTTLRCDHAVNTFPNLSEALLLDLRLAEPVAPFGAGIRFALDVFDLVSGRGDRDGLLPVLDILTARQDGLTATTLPAMVGALLLCCPVFVVTEDGTLQALTGVGDTEDLDDLPLPVPRPLDEIDRLLAAGVESTADLWLERGLAALADDRPDLALDSFDEAIRCDAGSGPAHLQRARLLRHTDMEEAARSLLRCAELGYAPGLALAWYGTLLFDNGRAQDALGVFRHLTETVPEYGPGWYERAAAAVELGRYDEAISAATTAVGLMPEHAPAFHTRACAYARTGQSDLALDDLARAVEFDGSLRSTIAADAHLAALRGHDRFAKLVHPWPVPGDGDVDAGMDPDLADMLRRGGWRPDELSVSLGTFSALEYPCPVGRLVVGRVGWVSTDESGTRVGDTDTGPADETVYLALRPSGGGGAGEAWLYTALEGDGREFAALVVAWQERLTPENFPDFAAEVRTLFPRSSWHWGQP